MPKINSLEVVHQDTNKDTYQNLHDILVELNKSLALNKEVVDGDARASIENLLEMYVNDKESFLRSVQTLTTKFKDSQSQFSEEIFLLSSQLESIAKRTTLLAAQTESNMASVREYAEAVSSTADRKISTYSQNTAPTGTLTYGDIWYDTDDNNRQYRWNGLVWVEVTKIPTFRQTTAPSTATVGDLWMDTDDNNKMYRWNGTSWIATDDSRIATSYSRWGVQTTAIGGGKTAVAGIQLNSDSTGTSEFTVLADNFRVYKSGNTSSPMFDVGTVNGVTTVGIKGNLVVDGSIVTKGLSSNTATISASNSIVNTSSTNASVSFTVSGLATGEQVPINISVGIVALASCGVAIYLNSTQLSLDGYTAGQLGYLSASTLVGNGTHSASISTDLTGSLSRRLSVFVAVSKR